MRGAYAVLARLAHVHLLSPYLRAADVAEVLASNGWRPAQALRYSLRDSDFARTIFIDGHAAAMFGVRELEDRVGEIWLLTTDVVDRYPIAFWKGCREVMRQLPSLWPVLVQKVDARHVVALRWARRLGFQVEFPQPWGPQGLPFHQITFTKAG